VAEWCEEAIEALAALSLRSNVVPLDESQSEAG